MRGIGAISLFYQLIERLASYQKFLGLLFTNKSDNDKWRKDVGNVELDRGYYRWNLAAYHCSCSRSSARFAAEFVWNAVL